MIIYFPKFYTEAHRTRDRQVELVDALARVGVLCSLEPSKCDLTFCGSIFSLPEVLSRGVVPPVIHYNWDLYPALVARDPVWVRYVRHLETCHRILVPNVGTAVRTLEIAGKMSSVVRSPVKLWDVPNRFAGSPDPRSYAVDVMRDYTWDANHMIARDACRIAGVPLVRTATSRPWDEFRWLVANASVLLSCYVEASTGGLTLLEGYAHGVPSIVSDSPLNGATEYLPGRCTTFDHRSVDSLVEKLRNQPPHTSATENRAWVDSTYREDVFAENLKWEFEQCL